MANFKTDDERKSYTGSFKIRQEDGKFLEETAEEMQKRGLTTTTNRNAAIEKVIDYARCGKMAWGWEEVILKK